MTRRRIAALETEVMRPLADAGPALTRDAGRLPGLGRRHRSLRTQIVRSSKHRPLPAQADRRLHGPRSHHAARRLRATGGRDRRSPHVSQVQHTSAVERVLAGYGHCRRRPRERHRAGNRLRVESRWSRITCCFVGIPQKHKTRFIISYTAQNRFHSVLLNTCSHEPLLALLAPARDRRRPACSPPWLELPGAAEQLAAWSQISGLDLAPAGHHRDGRGDHRHRGDPAAGGCRDAAGPRRADQARPAGRQRHRRGRPLRR